MSVAARYFDGRSAKAHPVYLTGAGSRLWIEGEGLQRIIAIAELDISEPLASAPRLLRLPDGAFCEVTDQGGLEQILEQAGHRSSLVVRAQQSWMLALLSLPILCAAAVAAYVWGLPALSSHLAERVPAPAVAALSARTLEFLDDHLLAESQLPPARQTEIAQGFAALPGLDRRQTYEILFRSSPAGPNALALPDGRLVLLDDLVTLADSDEQIFAVLGHELGHVHHRHGLRQMLQATALGVLTAWWFGDTSTLLVAAPTALLNARYSRGLETEADAYAVSLLRSSGLSPRRLGEMLGKLGNAVPEKTRSAGWLDYLSSHPVPRERIEAIEAAADDPPPERSPIP